MNEENNFVKDTTEARRKFFEKIGHIIDMEQFYNFKINKKIIDKNNYSEYKSIEFTLQISVGFLYREDILKLDKLGYDFYMNLEEGYVIIEERYYIRGYEK